mmetsp:Transcript_7140/g.18169  ORF Transcript_7140/g.18169 Transcript_7140/m.18169 type:complete len:577 (+) Transcript_7140:198-1928(+)
MADLPHLHQAKAPIGRASRHRLGNGKKRVALPLLEDGRGRELLIGRAAARLGLHPVHPVERRELPGAPAHVDLPGERVELGASEALLHQHKRVVEGLLGGHLGRNGRPPPQHLTHVVGDEADALCVGLQHLVDSRVAVRVPEEDYELGEALDAEEVALLVLVVAVDRLALAPQLVEDVVDHLVANVLELRLRGLPLLGRRSGLDGALEEPAEELRALALAGARRGVWGGFVEVRDERLANLKQEAPVRADAHLEEEGLRVSTLHDCRSRHGIRLAQLQCCRPHAHAQHSLGEPGEPALARAPEDHGARAEHGVKVGLRAPVDGPRVGGAHDGELGHLLAGALWSEKEVEEKSEHVPLAHQLEARGPLRGERVEHVAILPEVPPVVRHRRDEALESLYEALEEGRRAWGLRDRGDGNGDEPGEDVPHLVDRARHDPALEPARQLALGRHDGILEEPGCALGNSQQPLHRARPVVGALGQPRVRLRVHHALVHARCAGLEDLERHRPPRGLNLQHQVEHKAAEALVKEERPPDHLLVGVEDLVDARGHLGLRGSPRGARRAQCWAAARDVQPLQVAVD